MAANAAQARLQELPDAAALLATPAAAKSGDGALSNLNDWAPAPLLQVLKIAAVLLKNCAPMSKSLGANSRNARQLHTTDVEF